MSSSEEKDQKHHDDIRRLGHSAPLEGTWRTKGLILTSMLLLPAGSHYMQATLGTLKANLKLTMNINNTQFGILMSAVTLVNTILPLFAGAFVDDASSRLGSVRSTAMVSAFILIGSIIISLAATQENYPAMVTGQVICGFGGGMIVTMQEAIISKWFRDQQLAIVLGVLLAWARLVQWVAKMVCYPMMYSSGDNNTPIFVATIICAIGFCMNGVYWFIMYRSGRATGTGKIVMEEGHEPETRGNSFLATLRWILRWIMYLPGVFWMVPWLQIVMSSVLSSFDDIATEYIEFRFDTDDVMAGYQSSLSQAMPIVLAPILGTLIHRHGKRLHCMMIGALLLVLSMTLLGYTYVSPVVGMLIFSSALAFTPVAIISSTPMMLPGELAGVALGLHKCANNIGTTIVAIMTGWVQDLTYHDGDPNDNTSDLAFEYEGVMVLYLVLSCAAVGLIALFWYLDRRTMDGWLQADKKERDRRLNLDTQPAASHEELSTTADAAATAPGALNANADDANDTSTTTTTTDKQQHDASTIDTSDMESAANAREAYRQRITGNRLLSKRNWIYPSIYGFWLVAAWATFFIFALMPIYFNYDQLFS
ncbi:major facilitator superfamily domain-containing protein [Gongronella butleri]|nr:major facilitator superfamily domain-containing protein [Gongronella butleri]